MDWRLWRFVAELSILVSLGVALMMWLVRGELRELRRKRTDKRMRAQFGRKPLALRRRGAKQPVTVDELIARTKAERLPTRLRWNEKWPTRVLPRMEL
jgi:hypothetical protein